MNGWFSTKHENDVLFIYFTCLINFVLPSSVVDGHSRNPLYYYYYSLVLKVKVYMVCLFFVARFVDLYVLRYNLYS